MTESSAHGDLASACAADIYDGFSTYNFYFHTVTQRAAARFAARDWAGSQRDAVQRIELYEQAVRRSLTRVQDRLGDQLHDKTIWRDIKLRFEDEIRPYLDREFTKTFFSSVTRRIFQTEGVDPQIEFITIGDDAVNENTRYANYRHYEARGSNWQLFHQLMRDVRLATPFADLTECVNYLTSTVVDACVRVGGNYSIESVDVIGQVFYRDNRAYLIGRINGTDYRLPLVIPIRSTEHGAQIDGAVTDEDGVSIIFSFSRSYIHADLDIVRHAVAFLRTILPQKPVNELYTLLGRAKQGKTERYRNLFAHLQKSQDQFCDWAFDRGMVMMVFALPSYPVVFKVIRDRFAYPKTTVRRDVLDAYQLVFKHDRAGRLIDAQEFRHLKIARDRFEPALLDELLRDASDVVKVDGQDVIVEHLYIERRLIPLNQYLREASPAAARAAVIDYGDAIRDLASSNIFPGDLLLKNFGVTRHGRVIFFDYDELCLVTDCHFRDLPEARNHEEEMTSGAWFYVGDNDVFPEQFPSFLGLEGDLLTLFCDVHAALMDAQYWRDLKKSLLAGQVVDLLPYTPRQV
ncbi:MAG: bifunctional isocitrate dehydrogenase kinase/phosphatase [Gammaproteobacteria bacterium]